MLAVLKWIGIVLGSLIALVILAAAGLYTKSRLDFKHKYSVTVETVTVPADAASVEHGRHLATTICSLCHGADLGGRADFLNAGPMGYIVIPNLTRGRNGMAATFTDEDWVRVLRHGVKPDGTSVFLMPAWDFSHMSDEDLGALIAYLEAAPPADSDITEPHVRFTILGNLFNGAGQLGDLFAARQIERAGPPPTAPKPGVTAEYGDYLVTISNCRLCHGQDLAGAAGHGPEEPPGPNLTPGGVLKSWSEQDFITTLRTGKPPMGGQLRDKYMPWTLKGQMTDDELKAIWAYLQSLPALPTNTAAGGPP